MGFSILSGAGLFAPKDKEVHVHTTANAYTEAKNDSAASGSPLKTNNFIDLSDSLGLGEKIDGTAPVFVVYTEDDGSIKGGAPVTNLKVTEDGKYLYGAEADLPAGKSVFVDFYITKTGQQVDELQIDAANFAGYFYVEADTLFRRQSDGVDLPANLTFPNIKIQSNFTFTMASSGDPSTLKERVA